MERLRLHDGDWLARAACADTPNPDDFHNIRDSARRRRVLMTCDRCPVIEHCRGYIDDLEASVPRRFWEGIWAGETPDQRDTRRTLAVWVGQARERLWA